MIVGVAMRTVEPQQLHFDVRDAVVFQVVDSIDGDSARRLGRPHARGGATVVEVEHRV